MANEYQRLSDISIKDIHIAPLAVGEDFLGIIGDFKGNRFLELGCGGAQNTIVCTSKGGWAVGVDASIEQLGYARKLQPENSESELIRGDIESLDWIKGETFDWILSMFALEFVSDMDQLFASCHRILRPNGHVLFSTVHPLGAFEWDPEERALLTYNYFDPPVEIWPGDTRDINDLNFTIFRTIEEIVTALIDHGFKINKLLEPRALPVEQSDKSPYKGLYWEPYRDRLEKVPFALVIDASK